MKNFMASNVASKMAHKVGGLFILLALGLLAYANTIYAEDQASTVLGNKLPGNWPSDAPTYPGASINLSGFSNNGADGGGIALVIDTTDTLQKVVDFYKKSLADKGWKIASEASMGDTVVLAAEKGTMKYSIVMAAAGDHTQISSGIQTQ